MRKLSASSSPRKNNVINLNKLKLILQLLIIALLVVGSSIPWHSSAQVQDDRTRGANQGEKAVNRALAGITVSNMTVLTPSNLVQMLIGNNTPFSNATYTGAPIASGSFAGGTGIIGFEGGVLLTSGSVQNVVGPNTADGKTQSNGVAGDANLDAITPGTRDASVLEFDFVPSENTVTFQYVFASEEYNEYANSQYNDVFAFFLNGSNVALIPSTTTPVSINNVNGGKPYGTNAQNPQFYRNNDISDGGGSINTEMDGLTTVFGVTGTVIPNQTNHIKLAIADVSDQNLDSAVFIKSSSFIVTPPAGQLILGGSNYDVNEGNAGTATQTVTVNRIGGTAGAIVVNYATSNGTATGGASCGGSVDFVNSSGTLSFADGQTSKTFDVTICGETTVEPNETVNVTLTNPTGGATLGTPAVGTITIVNDDSGATPTPTPTPGPCPGQWALGQWNLFEGHYYSIQLITGSPSWQAARTQAMALVAPGGAAVDLAAITSLAENTFIFNGIDCPTYWAIDGANNNEGPFIGGNQYDKLAEPAGHFAWVTGESFGFAPWASGEPNNAGGNEDFVTFFAVGSGRAASWNDIANDAGGVIRYYIAESTGGVTPTPTPMGAQPAILGAADSSNQAVVFPDAYVPGTQVLVPGLPAGARPHGVAYFGSDNALISDFSNSRVFVVKISNASLVSTISTSAAGYNGTGTITVAPNLTAALAMGGSSSLKVIQGPFNASSTITSLTMPGSISGYQTEAIVFNNAGRAFVYHSAGISVLDPPYNSIAFTIPVSGNSSTGSIGITPDGNTLLTTTLSGNIVQIFQAPFSASTTPTNLTIPGGSSLDGIAVAPNGAAAIVVSSNLRHAAAIAAPFSSNSVVASIPMPSSGGSTGFEDVGISADSQIAILTGNSNTEPAVHIRAPFGASSVTTVVPITGVTNTGRGAGAVRFLPPGLAPGLTVSKTAPATVDPGANLTYTISYSNTGTQNASNVVIKDPLPAGTTFVSATGGGSLVGSNVVFNIGTVVAGAPAQTVSFTVTVNTAGGGVVNNNNYTIEGTGIFPIPGPPVTTSVSGGSQPTMSINDVSLNEGNSGTTSFNFTATLSAASAQTVTASFATANGTASSGSDYVAASGTVTFNPTETSKPVTVVVNGETVVEANETFSVYLSNPTNAAIADNQGVGTIVNDDGTGCTYSINPLGQHFTFIGGTGSVAVTTQAGCAWTATSNSLVGLAEDIAYASDSTSPPPPTVAADLAPEVEFSNTAPITISDSSPAAPYPSTINVSGVGNVTGVKVTINGFSHTWPYDIDMLLVGPGGQKLIIQSDAGGSGTVSNVNYTIDDAAAAVMPSDAFPATGTSVRPTNNGADDPFATPAPAGPYGNPAPAGTATLNGTFAGTSGNGAWNLYVMDDSGGDFGTISGGWALTLTTSGGNPFVTVTSGSSGTGNGTVNYSVAANSGPQRTGTMTIAGETFTVTQNAAGCSYTLSPSNNNVTSAAGSGSFNVNTTAGCTWTAASNNLSWLNVVSGSSGTGNGTVNYIYTANPGVARSATIAVGGMTFTLDQAAAPANCIAISLPVDMSVAPTPVVTIPVTVGDLTGRGVISYEFSLTFNSSILRPVQAAPVDAAGTLSSGFTVTPNISVPGQLTVSAFGLAPLSGQGTLLNLKFEILGGAGGTSALTWTRFVFNEGNPCSATTNGSVNVTSNSVSGSVYYAIVGQTLKAVPNTTLTAVGTPQVTAATDVAGAYTLTGLGGGPYTVTPTKSPETTGISAFDAALVAQHAANIITLTNMQQLAADASGNGTVSAFDAAYIAQTSAGVSNDGLASQWKFLPPNRSYATITSNQTGQNFDAILIGDVSGNWQYTPAAGDADDWMMPLTLEPAVESVAVGVPVVTGDTGTSITIPVTVGSLSGQNVIAYDFDLRFDPAVIQPSATPVTSAGTLSSALTVTPNKGTPGQLRVAAFGTLPLDGAGVLLDIHFDIVGTQGSTTGLTWQTFLFNEGQPAATLTNGSVTINQNQQSMATVSGRVLTPDGRGLRNAIVSLTDAQGVVRRATTSSFGNYSFTMVLVADNYFIGVSSKRYRFASRALNVTGNLTDVDFIGLE